MNDWGKPFKQQLQKCLRDSTSCSMRDSLEGALRDSLRISLRQPLVVPLWWLLLDSIEEEGHE